MFYNMVQEEFASMGVYLNGRAACTLYKNETEKPYFVDKAAMLEELFPLVREGNFPGLLRDLQAEYPQARVDWQEAVWDVFSDLRV